MSPRQKSIFQKLLILLWSDALISVSNKWLWIGITVIKMSTNFYSTISFETIFLNISKIENKGLDKTRVELIIFHWGKSHPKLSRISGTYVSSSRIWHHTWNKVLNYIYQLFMLNYVILYHLSPSIFKPYSYSYFQAGQQHFSRKNYWVESWDREIEPLETLDKFINMNKMCRSPSSPEGQHRITFSIFYSMMMKW